MSNIAALKKYIAEHSYKENHENPFSLASGKKSPYYVNLKNTLLHPQYLAIATSAMLDKILSTTEIDAVAGLTMGADPLLYAISLKSE